MSCQCMCCVSRHCNNRLGLFEFRKLEGLAVSIIKSEKIETVGLKTRIQMLPLCEL